MIKALTEAELSGNSLAPRRPDGVFVAGRGLELVEARGRSVVRFAVGEGVERQAANGISARMHKIMKIFDQM